MRFHEQFLKQTSLRCMMPKHATTTRTRPIRFQKPEFFPQIFNLQIFVCKLFLHPHGKVQIAPCNFNLPNLTSILPDILLVYPPPSPSSISFFFYTMKIVFFDQRFFCYICESNMSSPAKILYKMLEIPGDLACKTKVWKGTPISSLYQHNGILMRLKFCA